MRVSLIATYTTLSRNSFYGRNKEKRPGAWSNRPWIIFVHENIIKNLCHPDRLSMNSTVRNVNFTKFKNPYLCLR